MTKDIWDRGIETICNWQKRNLLDLLDSIIENSHEGKERNRLIQIKKSVHRMFGQMQFQVHSLFSTYRTGGSIEPFEDILRPEIRPDVLFPRHETASPRMDRGALTPPEATTALFGDGHS